MSSITFFGAARTVTGSKYLFETGSARVLVDAGLFQGLKELRLRNWAELPFDPASLSAIVLTHAHLDHCGFLPRLVARGYKGRVFCTPGTQDLCRIVLPDSARLQEEDAENANRGQYSKHHPALPLYTENDAWRALSLLQPVGYERPIPVADGVEVEFINAGHLLGSAYARVRTAQGSILFGGDLGRFGRPVLPDPTMVAEADWLLVESTYGNRVHDNGDDGARLAAVIGGTLAGNGRVIIPAFAMGRVEELIYWIRRLEEQKRIPVVPVFVDSPMAARALARYSERLHELDEELQPESRKVCVFCTQRFRTVVSAAESRQLTESKTPAIVISSSGMATGGRVLHHLARALPDARNTVLFVGFQAVGTRGRRLVDGEHEVKIHGRVVPVNARIEQIDSMSAHADANEILRWLRGFSRPPRATFLVHGEIQPMEALATRIRSELGWAPEMPDYGQRVALSR